MRSILALVMLLFACSPALSGPGKHAAFAVA
jgi:hypothetical protein